jgi:8-oxo-dGTP pyrophosphatase MutT (NUDIX family)
VSAAVEDGDAWSRDRALHLTASALVVHPGSRRVLLRWHARMERWLQVGGHGDPGETDPWAIALREAHEETGLTDLEPLTPALGRRPVQIVVVPVPAGRGEPAHEHADIRYLLATAHPEGLRPESADAAVHWLSFAEARARVTEANLHELLDRAERELDTAAGTAHT